MTNTAEITPSRGKTPGSGRKIGTPNRKPKYRDPITVLLSDIESIQLRSGEIIHFGSQTRIIS